MTKYFPAFLKLQGLACLVVGGGLVAQRKVEALLECGARVTVISPATTPQLRDLSDQQSIRWLPRTFQEGDTQGYYLVISATGDQSVNSQVAAECKACRIPVNVVDDPQNCSFLVPAVVRRGDLTIAVATGGASPLAARKIREELEETYGPEYEEYLKILAETRTQIKNTVKDPVRRRQIFQRLTDGQLLRLVQSGRSHEAKEWVKQCLSRQ